MSNQFLAQRKYIKLLPWGKCPCKLRRYLFNKLHIYHYSGIPLYYSEYLERL